MDLFGISPYLHRAKSLLATGDEQSIRYASLELRFCFELIAYRQLKQYGEKIPGQLASSWKADQIIKTLASFDPISDQAGGMEIGMPVEGDGMPAEWVSLGKTKAIPWRKFRKLYNKLGSYLHAPKDDETKAALNVESFGAIISALDEVQDATLILAVHMTIHADCHCGQRVFVGESEFDNGELVTCGNSKCNEIYRKEVSEKGEKVLTKVAGISASCDCGARIPIRKEDIWAPFRCPSCFTTYKVDLGYSKFAPLAER